MSKPVASEELNKLQIVCALFDSIVNGDLYYARQIKESIEAALPEGEQGSSAFVARANELSQRMDKPGARLELVPATEETSPFSLLALRAKLLAAAKATCLQTTGIVVLTGLKEAICPVGRRWTERRKREYEDAIAFARAFFQQRSRPSSKVSLVIF